jgi:glycosyltransferase involved in cell wall biosynthesis
MVTYNQKKYVAQAIDSYLNQQTDYTVEILVGDDASPDGTADYVREMYGDKVKVIARTQNVGLNRNLYDLYCAAKGRYIYGCAGDDWANDPAMLQKLAGFLDAHREYSSVSNWMRTVDADGKEIGESVCDNTEYNFADWITNRSLNSCGTGMLRNYFADLKEDVSYMYKVCRNNEEIPIWAFLLERGKHYIIHEKMLSYRYVNVQGSTNYNSTHRPIDVYEDYRTSLGNMEKYHPCYSYEAKQYKIAYDFLRPVLATKDIRQWLRFVRLLGFLRTLRLFFMTPYILRHGELPPRITERCLDSAKEFL